MRISDWSSDVCSSDLMPPHPRCSPTHRRRARHASSVRSTLRFQAPDRRARSASAPVRRAACRTPCDAARGERSEERRVGKECVVRVDLDGRRNIKQKKLAVATYTNKNTTYRKLKSKP